MTLRGEHHGASRVTLKQRINSGLRRLGFEIHRAEERPLGVDPLADMRKLLPSCEQPVVFDVGANVGQTIADFRQYFPDPIIHSFEPGPSTFEELRKRTVGIPNLYLNNVALGSAAGVKELLESSAGSPMDSLLAPGSEVWGAGGIKGKRQVQVTTVDAYCEEHRIGSIDILKTDTQGYDLEVLKGASGMLRAEAVKLVCIEILFGDMYQGQARVDEVLGFLMDHGLVLVTFYRFYFWGNKASWADALFMHPGLHRVEV